MKNGLGTLTKFNGNTRQHSAGELPYDIVGGGGNKSNFRRPIWWSLWEVSCHLAQSGGSQSHVHRPHGGLGFHRFKKKKLNKIDFTIVELNHDPSDYGSYKYVITLTNRTD